MILCLAPMALPAQAPLGGVSAPLRIISTDMAVLEAGEIRKDLDCTVTPSKPVLGFDLRFHLGYDVSVPMKDLAGNENQLTILFRVTAGNRPDEPSFFVQHVRVPFIPEESAEGQALLAGVLDIGEGNYHIDWLMRDRTERVCSFYWDSQAELPLKDKQIQLAIAPGVVEKAAVEQFTEEPPVARDQHAPPLNIKVLVNFGPQNPDSPALKPTDTVALVTMLRRISQEPEFRKFSLVAFNMQEQRVLYRQASADKIDFPALGEAVQKIKLGTVDFKKLGQKHADTEFLTELIKNEMASADHPDAVIFAGPKVMLEESVPDEALKPFASEVDYPVFYVNYALDPRAAPWRDSIGKTVKFFRGTEFTVSRPRDLWFALSDMVSRIIKSRVGKLAVSGGAQ